MNGKLFASACLMGVLCWAPAAQGASVAPGDSYADMISELGQPQGFFELENKTLYLYPAGKITVVDDVITEVELKTTAELEREAELKAEAARQWEAHQEMKEARHLEKGEQLKADKLTDPDFLSRSSGEQLAFWKHFQRDYPEIAVTEVITPLAERFAREQEELARAENQLKAQQQKIDTLEKRVQQAEQVAQEAQQQQDSGYYAFYGTEYPAYYYPYPQNRVVIVNGNGSTTVIPSNPRTHYQRSGLQIGGSVGSVNFRYSSGGGSYNRWSYPTSSTVIVRSQPQPPQNPPPPQQGQ